MNFGKQKIFSNCCIILPKYTTLEKEGHMNLFRKLSQERFHHKMSHLFISGEILMQAIKALNQAYQFHGWQLHHSIGF